MPTLQEQLKKNPKMGQIKLKNMLRKGKLKGTYTVKKGDSWFDIAGRMFAPLYDGDWKVAQTHAGELARANPHIANLRPGQQIRLPYRQAGYTLSRGRGAYVPQSMLSGGVPAGGPQAASPLDALQRQQNSQNQQQAANLQGPGTMAMDQGGAGGGSPGGQGNRGRPRYGGKPPGPPPRPKNAPPIKQPQPDKRSTVQQLQETVNQRKKSRGLNRGAEYGVGAYQEEKYGRMTAEYPTYTAVAQQKDELDNWWKRQVAGLQNINDRGLQAVQDLKANAADVWNEGVSNYNTMVRNQRNAAVVENMYRRDGRLLETDPWTQPLDYADAKEQLQALGKVVQQPFANQINAYNAQQRREEYAASLPSGGRGGHGYRRMLIQRQYMLQPPGTHVPAGPHQPQPTKNYGPVSDKWQYDDAQALGNTFEDFTRFAATQGDGTIEPSGIEGYLVSQGIRPIYWTPLAIEQNRVDVSLLPGLGYDFDDATGVWIRKPDLGARFTGVKPNYSNPYYRPGSTFRQRRGGGGGGGGGGRGAQPRYSRSERAGGYGNGRANPYRGGGVSWRIS